MIYPGRPDHPQAAIAQKQMRGGSTLVAFEIAGGKAAAFRFQDALKLVRITNNLGDAKSLITHPATTTHQRLDAGGARRTRHQRRAGALRPGSSTPTTSSRICWPRSRRCESRDGYQRVGDAGGMRAVATGGFAPSAMASAISLAPQA